jgi:ribosomal protein L11 methyltransferase
LNSKSKTGPAKAAAFARVSADIATAKTLANFLAEHLDFASVSAFEMPDGGWDVEVHSAEKFDEAALRRLIAEVAGDATAGALTFGTVEARDWVAASLEGLAPVEAGRFLIHGSHDRARAARAHTPIEIEAALAFGTGHHGTTRGCLIALDQLLRKHRFRNILDVGTGTGVLAIAAAKELHAHVVASDIDKISVIVARENAHLNHAASTIDFVHAKGVDVHRIRSQAPYDLIFANIILTPLKLLASPIAKLLAPHGRIVLSGLLPSHASAAMSAYRMQGLSLEYRMTLDGWTTMILRRGA